jgi:DNA-directed RNA polymerase specialized sigma24 family protein
MNVGGEHTFGNVKKDKLKTFEELFFKYHGRLVLFSVRFTGSLQASQDIVQDSFIALWEKPDSFVFNVSPRAYLFQTVRNKSLNFIRDNHTHLTIEQELALKFEMIKLKSRKPQN